MNPETCEHCRHAIAPYKPILSHEGARWHCAKHACGKWWDETCNQFTPRMKTEQLPERYNTKQPIDPNSLNRELIAALETLLDSGCKTAWQIHQAQEAVREVIRKSKGQS